MDLTHINERNNPTMVDVSEKNITSREALASGKILVSKQAYDAVLTNTAKKGPVIQTAIIAAIMAAKNTSVQIPMCHPLSLSKVDVQIEPFTQSCPTPNAPDSEISESKANHADSDKLDSDKQDCERLDSEIFGFKILALVKCEGKTGVEMEALHAASIGLLTIYDMLKAIDKSMIISNVQLEKKSGGKSGDFQR